MAAEQILIGGMTAALCVLGLWNVDWLLEHTRKGRRLVARFGEVGASRVLKMLLLAGAIFGGLLAGGIINPIHWSSSPAPAHSS